MFQFTTTNVINANVDYTTGKALWSTQNADDSKPASLYVKRVNKFLAPNIVAIYKAVATDPELAKVTLDLSSLSATKGDAFRLYMYVALSQGSNDSRYANDLEYKGKAFSVDFVFGEDASKTAEKLVKTINKYEMLIYGDKQLKATNKTTFVSIEAMNEYQRFRVVNIEKFDKDAHNGMGEYTPVITLEDLGKPVSHNADLTGSAKGYFPGKEGFGTYSYILHNLRIPTCARTRAFAPNQDETPIVGAKYNQYTLYYCVNRGILGDNAVGDLVKSMTTHVFYVKSDIADTFETALQTVGTIVEVNKTGTPDPMTVAGNLEALAKKVDQVEKKASANETNIEKKQDKLTAGNGIELDGTTVKVKVDGDTLTASVSGLKVADNKFQKAQ